MNGLFEIDKCPSRNDFLIKDIDVNTALDRATPLYFLPFSELITNGWFNNANNSNVKVFGALENGQKAVLHLDIDISCDIRIDSITIDSITLDSFITRRLKNKQPESNDALISITRELVGEFVNTRIVPHLRAVSITISRYTIEYAKPFKGFSENPIPYLRIYYKSKKERAELLKLAQSEKWKTASDETSADDIAAKLSREYGFSLTNWNVITNYKYRYGEKPHNDIINIYAEAANYKESPYNEERYINPNKQRKNTDDDRKTINAPISMASLKRQRILIMAWDIETYSGRLDADGNRLNDLPNAEHDEDCVFLISCVFRWSDMDSEFLRVSLVTPNADLYDRGFTVICNDQVELLANFGKVLGRMRPDMITGFNDSCYDWPFVITKMVKLSIYANFVKQAECIANKYKTIDDDKCYKYTVKKVVTKIKADEFVEGTTIDIDGVIMVDTMTIFRKLTPDTPKYSLNYFLEMNKLGQKVDMPYLTMFSIYERISKNKDDKSASFDMINVVHYCVEDANACHKLWLKRNVLLENRSLAEISFVSLRNSFNRANGVKCRCIAMANSIDIAFSYVIEHESNNGEKYPGAFVVDPVHKGIYRRRPVSSLDFASLYPSIIRTYNLSPEMIVKDKQEAERLEAQGYTLHYISVPMSTKTHTGWVVRHDNDFSKMGIYPIVLDNLFRLRSSVKKQIENNEKKIKELASLDNTVATNTTTDAIQAQIDELSYGIVVANAKQKALKILMNTFYGETGNELSAFYELLIAGGITTNGVNTIKKTLNFAVDNYSYQLLYGDTDSLYMSAPEADFADADKQYEAKLITKREYWDMMVKINKRAAFKIKDLINDMLYKDNGTKYLTMAYEHTGMPSFWACKKKYTFFIHDEEDKEGNPLPANFDALDLDNFCIKGLEIIKRGHTDIMLEIGNEIVKTMMNIDCEDDAETIVYKYLEDIFKREWDIANFVRSATYRPAKDNKSVLRFVKRMKERGITIPDPGTRFDYVVVLPSDTITIRGTKIDYKVGDLMEYPDEANKRGLKINLSQYLSGEIKGMLARFISHTCAGEDDEECYKNAKKVIVNKIDDLSGEKSKNKEARKEQKDKYKDACNQIYEIIERELYAASIDRVDESSTSNMRDDIVPVYVPTRIPVYVLTRIPALDVTTIKRIISNIEVYKDGKKNEDGLFDIKLMVQDLIDNLPEPLELTKRYVDKLRQFSIAELIKLRNMYVSRSKDSIFVTQMKIYRDMYHQYLGELDNYLNDIQNFDDIVETYIRDNHVDLTRYKEGIIKYYDIVMIRINTLRQTVADLKYICKFLNSEQFDNVMMP